MKGNFNSTELLCQGFLCMISICFHRVLKYSKTPRLRTYYAKICQLSPTLFKNQLFSLKFKTGSSFLKSMKKFCTLEQIRQHSESSSETVLCVNANV